MDEERDDFNHDFKNQSFKCKTFKLFELIQLYEKIYNIFYLINITGNLKNSELCTDSHCLDYCHRLT